MRNITITEYTFGWGVSAETGRILRERGVKIALCIYDKNLEGLGLSGPIIDSIKNEGIQLLCCSDVETDPSADLVNRIAERYRGEAIDAVVGIGGGSALDTAKAVNILFKNPGHIEDYFEIGKKLLPCGPLFLIPTTAGTGSEMTNLTVISDLKNLSKCAILNENCRASRAIVDPALCKGLPKYITAYTGMDTISHAVEAYTARFHNRMADILAREAIELVMKNIKTAAEFPGNIDARSDMSFASLLGGICIDTVSVQLGHGIAHALGAAYHIPHGVACALVLPGLLEILSEHVESAERTRELASFIGIDVKDLNCREAGFVAADQIRALNKELGIQHISKYVDSLEGVCSLAEKICADAPCMMAPFEVKAEYITNLFVREFSLS